MNWVVSCTILNYTVLQCLYENIICSSLGYHVSIMVSSRLIILYNDVAWDIFGIAYIS